MGNEISILLSAVDNASKIAGSAGLKFTELNSAIGIAKQGYEAINKVIDATVGKTVEYANTVRKMTSTLGISSEEGSRLIQVFDDYGVKADQLNNILDKAAKNGFQVSIDSLAKLADETNAMTDPTERAAALSKIFGLNWADVSEVLRQGGDAIRSQAAGISDSLVLTKEAIQQARDYEIALDNWDDTTLALSVSIGQKLIPAITALLDPQYNAKQLAKWSAEEIANLTEKYKDAPPHIQRYWGAIVQEAQALKETNQVTKEHITNTAYAYRMNEQFRAGLAKLPPVIKENVTDLDKLVDVQDKVGGYADRAKNAIRGQVEQSRRLALQSKLAATALEGLKTAQENLSAAQQDFKQKVAQGVLDELKNMGLTADQLATAMQLLSDATGATFTDEQLQAKIEAFAKIFAGILTAPGFKDKVAIIGDIQDFVKEVEPLSEDIQTAKTDLFEAWSTFQLFGDKTVQLKVVVTATGDVWILDYVTGGGGGGGGGGDGAKIGDYSGPKNIDKPAYQVTQMVKAQLNREVTAARRSGSFMAGRK